MSASKPTSPATIRMVRGILVLTLVAPFAILRVAESALATQVSARIDGLQLVASTQVAFAIVAPTLASFALVAVASGWVHHRLRKVQ